MSNPPAQAGLVCCVIDIQLKISMTQHTRSAKREIANGAAELLFVLFTSQPINAIIVVDAANMKPAARKYSDCGFSRCCIT